MNRWEARLLAIPTIQGQSLRGGAANNRMHPSGGSGVS